MLRNIQSLLSRIWLPAKHQNGYPLDLHPSLRYARPPDGVSYRPTPGLYTGQPVGAIQFGFPMQDAFIFRHSFAASASGPNINQVPVNLQYQQIIPGLNKEATT